MATKPQAKTAIDNTVTQIKADLDNIVPAGVNIVDGRISFSPSRWTIIFTVADMAAADTLLTGITANLTTAARTYTIDRRRRADDSVQVGSRSYLIITTLATYQIIGF